MVVAMMLKYILTLSPLIVIVIVAMTLRYIVYLDLEDGVRMGQDKGIFPRFFAVPNIPSPEIAKYRQFKFELNPPMVHYWPGVNRGKDVLGRLAQQLGRLTQDGGRVLLSEERRTMSVAF